MGYFFSSSPLNNVSKFSKQKHSQQCPRKTFRQGLGSGGGEGSIQAVHKKENWQLLILPKNDYNFPFYSSLPTWREEVHLQGHAIHLSSEGQGDTFQGHIKRLQSWTAGNWGRKITWGSFLMKCDVSCHEKRLPTLTGSKNNRNDRLVHNELQSKPDRMVLNQPILIPFKKYLLLPVSFLLLPIWPDFFFFPYHWAFLLSATCVWNSPSSLTTLFPPSPHCPSPFG